VFGFKKLPKNQIIIGNLYLLIHGLNKYKQKDI